MAILVTIRALLVIEGTLIWPPFASPLTKDKGVCVAVTAHLHVIIFSGLTSGGGGEMDVVLCRGPLLLRFFVVFLLGMPNRQITRYSILGPLL